HPARSNLRGAPSRDGALMGIDSVIRASCAVELLREAFVGHRQRGLEVLRVERDAILFDHPVESFELRIRARPGFVRAQLSRRLHERHRFASELQIAFTVAYFLE